MGDDIRVEKNKGNDKTNKIQTFTIQYPFPDTKENISNHSQINPFSEMTRDQIITQALELHLQGKITEATEYYKYLIDQGFNDNRVFANYGSILSASGELEEAEIYLKKSIELNPNVSIQYVNLGRVLMDLKKSEEAEIILKKAIELNPEFIHSYNYLGNLLFSLGKLNESEIYIRKALEFSPDSADLYFNLSLILHQLGQLEEAKEVSIKGLKMKPNNAINYYNHSIIMKDLGKLKDAEDFIKKAIKLRDDYPDALFLLSFIQMFQDDYFSGLKNYEFRFRIEKAVKLHSEPKIPKWDGKSLERGEKLLIITEQGLGDTIHFMRYIPYLKHKGMDVLFCAQETLHDLIKESGIDSNPLTPKQANLITKGKYFPLLSLPMYFGVTKDNPLVSDPYIAIRNELIGKWENVLEQEKRPIVGISWQGNPLMEQGSLIVRSIPLETFSDLAKSDKYSFLSLQKGFGSEQLEDCSFKNKFVKCQNQICNTTNFLDTAAHIQNCDLIITNDSCVAHLAAGMGKPTWVLLSCDVKWTWRYGLGETTFWYPSMKLFHQKERGNWKEVMTRVLLELKHFL